MSAVRWALPVARSRVWPGLVLLGAAVLLTAGRQEGWARLLGGALVAAGILQQVLLLLLARRRHRARTFWVPLPTALVLTVGVAAWYEVQRPGVPVGVVLAVLVLAAALLLNRDVPRAYVPVLLAEHLPHAPRTVPPPPPRPYGWLAAGFCTVLALTFLAGAVRLPVPVLVAAALLTAAALVLLGAPHRRVRAYSRQLERALAELAPVWAMPYNGGATFHLGMWAPYLQRTGRPLLVVTTSPTSFARVAAAYDLPVVCAPGGGRAAVSALFPPSVRAAFYVFNGSNRLFLSVDRVRHVFLQHGDSDKAGSAHPFSVGYDTIVVSGRAGIDRFARSGFDLPPEKFVVLGRPQTEDIETVTRPIAGVAVPLVLYAPTWKGKSERTNYSSLLQGPRIVEALLARGAVVMFRPHPAGRRYAPHVAAIEQVKQLLAEDAARTGRPHRWGDAAEALSVAEVTNLSDAMVADVSGIVTDYMQSLKPFAMVATRCGVEEFRREFPTSQSAYVIPGDLVGLDGLLADMLGPDPLAERRRERRTYYLGDFGPGGAAAAFVAWVSGLQAEPPRSDRAEGRPAAVERAVQHR